MDAIAIGFVWVFPAIVVGFLVWRASRTEE